MRVTRRLCVAGLLLAGMAAVPAHAADVKKPAPRPPAYLVSDQSTELLMDPVTAASLWVAQRPPKLVRLYPVRKWGFVSQVEGGFDESKVCVITARAMMLPRKGKDLVLTPAKTATAYSALPGASLEQCKAMAKTKLGEAIDAVYSALLRQ